MRCPECAGEGVIKTGVVHTGVEEATPCHVCGGTGRIFDESDVYGNDCLNGRCEV